MPIKYWQRLTVSLWGEVERTVDIASVKAVWFHKDTPHFAMRGVLSRDRVRRFKTQALPRTDPHTGVADIAHGFVRRWQLEVIFEEVMALDFVSRPL